MRISRYTCDTCLWNWINVKTGKGHICYHNTSPYYHKRPGGKACAAYETKVYEQKKEEQEDESDRDAAERA